jgi:TMEM175 potassium channel family protein
VDRSRLEAFSDGVIAVAITLLALDLTVAGPGHGPLLDQLKEHRFAFVAYLISFLTIGIIWVNHHALVRSIKTVDRTLLFLNLMLLVFIVLIPFATAAAADYLPVDNWDRNVAMMIYGGVFLGMSVGFSAIFEWTLHGRRVYRPLPAEQHWAARRRFAGGGLVYAVAIVVAVFNAYASFAIIGLVAVYYIFERTPSTSVGDPDGGDRYLR